MEHAAKRHQPAPSIAGAFVLEHLPEKLKRRRHVGEPNSLELLLLSDSTDPEFYQNLIINSKMGQVTVERLSPPAVVALGHVLASLSNKSSPELIAMAYFALMETITVGWELLTPLKQSAFASLMAPSESSTQRIRDTAEIFSTLRTVELFAATGKVKNDSTGYVRQLYLTLLHDEGQDGKANNKLVGFIVWRNADGTWSKPTLIGVLDCAKTGADNARALTERLEELLGEQLKEMGLTTKDIVVLSQVV